jgi:hypothetical protein
MDGRIRPRPRLCEEHGHEPADLALVALELDLDLGTDGGEDLAINVVE